MRKTKCKSCNGSGKTIHFGQNSNTQVDCMSCAGYGEISVYTIQELRDGKVDIKNDSTADKVCRLINFATGGDFDLWGESNFYAIEGTNYVGYQFAGNRPTQSVKIFLEEIEQEEEEEKQQYATYHGLVNRHAGFKADPIIEKPEFKWGEWVESDLKPGVLAKYVERYPMPSGGHVIVYPETYNEDEFYTVVNSVRKPQKITITLSQIAEKFNCKPEQIEILPYART